MCVKQISHFIRFIHIPMIAFLLLQPYSPLTASFCHFLFLGIFYFQQFNLQTRVDWLTNDKSSVSYLHLKSKLSTWHVLVCVHHTEDCAHIFTAQRSVPCMFWHVPTYSWYMWGALLGVKQSVLGICWHVSTYSQHVGCITEGFTQRSLIGMCPSHEGTCLACVGMCLLILGTCGTHSTRGARLLYSWTSLHALTFLILPKRWQVHQQTKSPCNYSFFSVNQRLCDCCYSFLACWF